MKNIICKHCGRFLDMSKKERKGLCDKHYLQQLKYGYFLDDNQRTKGDPNNIIIYEDYAEIELYDIYGNIIEKTMPNFAHVVLLLLSFTAIIHITIPAIGKIGIQNITRYQYIRF